MRYSQTKNRMGSSKELGILAAIGLVVLSAMLGTAVGAALHPLSTVWAYSNPPTADAADAEEPVANVVKTAKFVPDPAVNQQPAAVAVISDAPDVTVPKTNGNGTTKTNPTPAAPVAIAPVQPKPAPAEFYKATAITPKSGDCSAPVRIAGTIRDTSGKAIKDVNVRVSWVTPYDGPVKPTNFSEGTVIATSDTNGAWRVESSTVNDHQLEIFTAAVVSKDGKNLSDPLRLMSVHCASIGSWAIGFEKR